MSVRIRHVLLPWRVFEVEAGSLRTGAERAGRMLAGDRTPWRGGEGETAAL